MSNGSCSQAGWRMRAHAWRFILIGFLGLQTLAGQPVDYYASAAGLSGNTLKTTLEGIIDGHTTLSYTPGVWEAHKDLYEDPNDSSRLILFYSQASWDKSAQDPGSGSTQYWNREHLWPRSYGVGSSGSDNTDLFALVPANKSVNNDRSNNYFDYADPSKSGYEDPANALAPLCKENGGLIWEPADGQKGRAARALLYMTTRYSYLELVDTPPSPAPNTSSSRMAQLSVMLEWNRKFLPAAFETTLNQRIFDDYQGNRNPYIDFPEFADQIWITGPSWGGWRLAHFTLSELADDLISGDGADPDGDGLSNLMEMARYSDPRTPDDEPEMSFAQSGGELLLSFARASDMMNLNLELLLESSTDFVVWDPVNLSGSAIDALDSNSETVTIRLELSPSTPLFFRLRAARPAL
jgi:endonuclease I